MHGRGLLEWNSVCWYEGDFLNGYRHGRGTMVDGENRYLYCGQWHMGQRHGMGYCRYGDNGSYDGDWVMDIMNGVGLRIYPNGDRYVGQWKNGIRDGIGTMAWTNGNVYRGEWTCGAINGYGEYVWNGFFNKTFTWPQEASYAGYWRYGMRNGKGEIKLNSVGGAKFSGYWKNNKKHGYGTVIGNNGERSKSNLMFSNDVLYTSNVASDLLECETEMEDEENCVRAVKEIKHTFVDKPNQLTETAVTSILKPEQFPDLSYYITRLLDPKSLEPPLIPAVPSGKCHDCENESCSCLMQTISTGKNLGFGAAHVVVSRADRDGGQVYGADVTVVAVASEQEERTQTEIDSKLYKEDTGESVWRYEERWTYNCLTLHMFRLREIYNDYAKLFAKSAYQCNLVMTRLCLWQMWRDCGIHRKGLSLIEIDDYIAKNETTLMKDPHHPFEKIEIWQFLHALLEISWHLYTKYDDVETVEMNGKLAGGLHKLLENNIYPQAGNHVGSVCQENQNLLPIYCVFELCQQIGYPFSAKDLLRATCALKSTTDLQPLPTIAEAIKNFPDGINSVTIGEKVSYLLKLDEILASPHCTIDVSRKNDDTYNRLLVYKQLEASKMVEIMTLICPEIKDANNSIIKNMDYKLTFLEFYEIILEATKQLLSLKTETEKELQTKKVESKTTSLERNNLQEKRTSRSNEYYSTRKDTKIKNRA
ncbi:Radial spoke head 10 like protein B [Habropoda laboriosa]|uniref:Radial spoke head 10 like protein B n=1 Tax=Habropoda laboriosa TaxID=597456 RepID=A0A0L7QW32_9HYME|nr:Radial spoke head 10 like protein B [Habropoda laboriosa]